MRPLSSTLTSFYKRVVPLIGGAASLLLLIGGIAGAIQANQPAFFFFPFLLTTVWLLFWWYLLRPLVDSVWLDDADLVIRNGDLEERIVFGSIVTVEGSYFTNPERITITLREPGPFGDTIVFLPPKRYFRLPFTSHPLAGELRDIVCQHA